MKKIAFNINYIVEDLQIKTNPLLSHIKVFLVHEGRKKIIAQNQYFQDNKMNFHASISESNVTLPYNEKTMKYQHYTITFLLQFEAEARFIKLGEVNVNLADIVNFKQNGRLIQYQVDKCYDRGSKLKVSIEMNKIGLIQQKSGNELTVMESGQNAYYLPKKNKDKANLMKQNHKTQYSIKQNQDSKQFSLINQLQTSYHTRQNQTPQKQDKTEINKKVPPVNQQIVELSEQLNLTKTNLRIAQQEVVAISEKYKEMLDASESIQKKYRQVLDENVTLKQKCRQYERKIKIFEKRSLTPKDASNTQLQKYIGLYHQSEQARNNLLIQVQTVRIELSQKLRATQVKLSQQQNKTKTSTKMIEQLRIEIKSYKTETHEMKKAYEREKKVRHKLKEQIDKTLKSNKNAYNHKQNMVVELNQKIGQVNEELQLCRFSLNQLSKELSVEKQKYQKEHQQKLNYQQELDISNQTIRMERANYSDHIKNMENKIDAEKLKTQDLEQYIEELEGKAIQQYSNKNEIHSLKKQITSLKQSLEVQQKKVQEMQNSNSELTSQRTRLEKGIKAELTKNMQLVKEKTNLDIKLHNLQAELEFINKEQKSESRVKEEKQLLMKHYYSERDLFWQKQIDKIQNDTLNLIEQWKQEKMILSSSKAELESKLNEKSQQEKEMSETIKGLEQNITKLKKNIKLLQTSEKKNEQKISKNITEFRRKEQEIENLMQKISISEQNENKIQEYAQKMTLKEKQLIQQTNIYEKQKKTRLKQKYQIKEIVLIVSDLICKSEKYKIFYEELKIQTIDHDVLQLLNSSLKEYCEKHNKIRQKLDKMEQLKTDIEHKEKQIQKLNAVIQEDKRKSQILSLQSLADFQQDDDSVVLSKQKYISLNQRALSKKNILKQEQSNVFRVLKMQNEEMKQKCQRDIIRIKEFERDLFNKSKTIDKLEAQILRISSQLENKNEQLSEKLRYLKSKDNQLNHSKQELKELLAENNQLKYKLEQSSKIIQHQKSQALARKNISFNKSIAQKSDQSFMKIMELEKKLKMSQEETDRLKKQKEDRKKEDLPLQKQVRILELKIKEKQSHASQFKRQIQEQKNQREKERQIQTIRQKKLKADHEEELERRFKLEKQLKQQLSEEQEMQRNLQKKVKTLEQSLKNFNSQLNAAIQKEQKAKKRIQNEWQLKLKGIQTQNKNEQSVLRRLIQEHKANQKLLRQTIHQKQNEISSLKHDIDKRQLRIEELLIDIQVSGMKMKNMEDEEGQFKETIGQLERKIKFDSFRSSQKTSEKGLQNNEMNSVVSLKTFTFR